MAKKKRPEFNGAELPDLGPSTDAPLSPPHADFQTLDSDEEFIGPPSPADADPLSGDGPTQTVPDTPAEFQTADSDEELIAPSTSADADAPPGDDNPSSLPHTDFQTADSDEEFIAPSTFADADAPPGDDPAPSAPDGPALFHSDEGSDHNMPAPAPAPAPLATLILQPPLATHVSPFSAPEIEDRLRRLEQTLIEIKEVEKRLAARLSGEPPPESLPPKSEASSLMLLSGVASLLEVGRLLLPAALAGPGTPPTPGSLADLLADLRAMYRMIVDPRYAMTWLGRLGLPGFLILFLFPDAWLPFNSYLRIFGSLPVWLYLCLGQLLAGFALFRVATYEARRYRETAPDLPPSLRI